MLSTASLSRSAAAKDEAEQEEEKKVEGTTPETGKESQQENSESDRDKASEQSLEAGEEHTEDTEQQETAGQCEQSEKDQMEKKPQDEANDITGMSLAELGLLVGNTRDRLRNEHEVLEQVLLKDYTSLPALCTATAAANYQAQHITRSTKQLCGELQVLTHTIAALRKKVASKVKEEELEAWITSTEEEDKIQAAETKHKHVAAAKFRQEIAEAEAEVARAAKEALEAAEVTRQLEEEAEHADAEAEKAKKELEKAKQAAIEKEKSEAEARRRAVERAKQKAEEERKQKEEEERQRKLLERAKGTPEEQRLLQEREERERALLEKKDPDKWPRLTYSVEPSDNLDLPLGCVLRVPEGVLQREQVIVERLEQLDCPVQLGPSEELVGNIISIAPVDANTTFNFEEPMALSFPHVAPKNNIYREAVVKIKSPSGRWMELTSREVFFPDIRDFRFVEVRLKRFGTFAVVTRFKKDNFTAGRRGARLVSTVDQRVTLQVRPTTFNVDTKLSLSVQPVELSAVTDLRTRYSDTCSQLLASSPILHLTVFTKKFSKNVALTMPCPANPSKFKRPQTAVSKDRGGAGENKAASRPKSAFHTVQREEEDEDSVHLLRCDAKNSNWQVLDKVMLSQSKNKDIISFELDEPIDRLVVLRTQNGLTNGAVEKIAKQLHDSIQHRIVQIVLRQNSETLNDIAVHCSLSNRMDRTLRKLSEEGYDDGPAPSADLVIKEGQPFEIRFRGNMECSEEDQKLKFIFNSMTRNCVTFRVQERERFAQKSLPLYRGFAQMVTRGLVPKELSTEDKDKRGKFRVEYEEADLILAELLISLPKPDDQTPQIIKRAPVKIVHEGPVNEEIFCHLSKELGDEWKLLAKELHIYPTRIQAILRNNVDRENDQTIYDMLVTWAKRIPRSMDKAELLITALEECGRDDLAVYVYDANYKYRQERAEQFRELHLQRAFVTVAQSPKVAADWRLLSKGLALTEFEIEEVEQKTNSVREQCLGMLMAWSKKEAEHATAQELARQLRRLRHRGVADQVVLQAGGL